VPIWTTRPSCACWPAAPAYVVGTRTLMRQQVADRAGLSRSFVSVFETGRHGIDVTAPRRLARALHVPLPALIAEPGDHTDLGDLIRQTQAE